MNQFKSYLISAPFFWGADCS